MLDSSGFQFVRIEMAEAGLQPYGLTFSKPDWSKVVQAIGLSGIRLEDPGDVRDRVAEFLVKANVHLA